MTNLSGSDQKVTVKLEALDPVGIVDGTRTVTLKDKQRTTLRFTASTTGSYGLGLMRLTVDGQGGASRSTSCANRCCRCSRPTRPSARCAVCA